MELIRSPFKYTQDLLGLSSPTPLYVGAAAASVVFSVWLVRRYFGGGVCRNKNRLDGKVAIITGANTGIGKETAADLARRGAKVYMACRSMERGRPALEDVKRVSGSSNVFLMKMDLGSKRSIKEFADDFLVREPALHILINNAGRMHTPEGKTVDGFETQMGTNHLGHFYLTHLLLDRLKASSPSRIINVSSLAHAQSNLKLDDLNMTKSGYGSFTAYGNSKLANILHAMELSRRLQGTGVTAYSLHPGAVATELAREYSPILHFLLVPFVWLLWKTPWQGAQTSIYLATERGIEGLSGSYFADCHKKKPSRNLDDPEKAKELWEVSEHLLEIED